jgi:cobalt-precorrin-5B (C1)-methyltransferase
VARALGLPHIAGCTGRVSERAVRRLYDLSEQALIDMGDFAGGLLKYVRRHPVARLTIGGGPAKLAKLGMGRMDLHSSRARVDMRELARWAGDTRVAEAHSVSAALELAGEGLAEAIAEKALEQVREVLADAPVRADVVVVSRQGRVLARAGA